MRAIRSLKGLPQSHFPTFEPSLGCIDSASGSASTAYAPAGGSSSTGSATFPYAPPDRMRRSVFRRRPTVTVSSAVAGAAPEASAPASALHMTNDALELLLRDDLLPPAPLVLPPRATTATTGLPELPQGPPPPARRPLFQRDAPVWELPAFAVVIAPGADDIASLGLRADVSSLESADRGASDAESSGPTTPVPEVPVTTHCRRSRLTRAEAMAKIADARRRHAEGRN